MNKQHSLQAQPTFFTAKKTKKKNYDKNNISSIPVITQSNKN